MVLGPKHSENTSSDIIDESSEVAEYSSNIVNVHFNCFMIIMISSLRLVEQNPEYSRRTLLDFFVYKRWSLCKKSLFTISYLNPHQRLCHFVHNLEGFIFVSLCLSVKSVYTRLHAPGDLFSSVDNHLAFSFVYLTVSKHQYVW